MARLKRTLLHLLIILLGVVSMVAGSGIIPISALGTASPVRHLPPVVFSGQTFPVTVNFTAPADILNSIALTDHAPAGWTAAVDSSWCSPAPDFPNAAHNEAGYIWMNGQYNFGTAFTVVYRVTVPPDEVPGTYSFNWGILEYYIGNQTVPVETIAGDANVTLQAGSPPPATTSSPIPTTTPTPIASPTPPASQPSGGYSGGGGTAIINCSPDGFTDNTSLNLDGSGKIQATVRLKALDEKTSLQIPLGTKISDSSGQPLRSLTAANATSPPASPAQAVILSACRFGPDGAKFEPPVMLSISYDPAVLPSGATEKSLGLAYWNESQWVNLPSMFDTSSRTVSANISHFTEFALIARTAPLAPPKWTISDFKISPAEVDPGEPVTIQLAVSNGGGSPGKYLAVLKVNNTGSSIREVNLDSGQSETVVFQYKPNEPGKYFIEVNGNTGEFTVKGAVGKPGAVAAPLSPATDAQQPAPQPAPAEKGFNWFLWIGAGLGVVLAVPLGWFFVRWLLREYWY